MGQVTATASTSITAEPAHVLATIADYAAARPKLLTEHYRDYRVVEGGQGDGTIAEWTLQATSKRSRDVRASVTTTDDSVVESDENSSMVTTWLVAPAADGCQVTLTTTWQGAGGIGGFFEGIFAPKGLVKIHDAVLARLRAEVETT